ncbi:hypothetical protein SEA_KRISHELLE_70 [Rhodococcus phage Krishelle]|uniref:Uncharacterized protein n=1 Tax=Rhodococcus phage Krishelle TaxID=2015829 RepID=A0A222ZK85_9CAUD|nr:hypothetical protein SEA_KRISHELLE_70 [Rhodococcus phage Krishelle]
MSSRCSKRIKRPAGINLADRPEQVNSTASPVQVGAETTLSHVPTVVKSSDRAVLAISLPTEIRLHDPPGNTKSPGQRVFLTVIPGGTPFRGGREPVHTHTRVVHPLPRGGCWRGISPGKRGYWGVPGRGWHRGYRQG